MPVFVPAVPPVSVPAAQEKPVTESAREMLFPAVPFVLAVTVTVVVPPDEAVTPIAGKEVLQLLITLAMLEAKVVLLLLVAKVAPANDEQAFEPSAPAVGPDVHEKGTLVLLLTVSVGAVPGVTCVIVVVLVLDVAVIWVFEML